LELQREVVGVQRGEVNGAFALGIAGRWAGDFMLLGARSRDDL